MKPSHATHALFMAESADAHCIARIACYIAVFPLTCARSQE
jgi:hypothetical protein